MLLAVLASSSDAFEGPRSADSARSGSKGVGGGDISMLDDSSNEGQQPRRERTVRLPAWNVEEWRLFFNGFQALGAVAIAALAIYGVFFTSIPETIVRQLRADVADAREELSGLRAERNRLVANLDSLNAGFREITEKSKQADQRLVAATKDLAATSSELTTTQTQLQDERANVGGLRSEAEALKAASLVASAKLQQLESDIARLSADREGYLKVAQGSAFLRARATLADTIRLYGRAVTAAKTYLEAPRKDALVREYEERIDRVRRTDPRELRRLVDELIDRMRGELPRGASMGFMRAEIDDATGDKFYEAWSVNVLAHATQLPMKSGRELVLEQFTSPGSFTAADFAVFRRTIEAATRGKAGLSQSLLVDAKKIEQHGEVASKEIARSEAAIKVLEEFLDEFQEKLAAGQSK